MFPLSLRTNSYDITVFSDLVNVVGGFIDNVPLIKNAVVLAMHGGLGTGKTTFTQILAKHLGVNEVVNSPTFVIMKQYDLSYGNWKQLVHMDAYRIDGLEELSPLHLTEHFNNQETLVCVEWAERIKEALPTDQVIDLYFSVKDQRRTLVIKND